MNDFQKYSEQVKELYRQGTPLDEIKNIFKPVLLPFEIDEIISSQC